MTKPNHIKYNMKLTPQEQQFLAQRMNEELEKVTMSWNNDLKVWHEIALQALDHASTPEMQIPQQRLADLFKTEKHGLNMNIVMVLCNNLESRKPVEMGLTASKWADVLLLNKKVSDTWAALQAPVQKKIEKEFEIMKNKPKLVMVPGEA